MIHEDGIVTKHENRFERLESRANALEGRMSLQEAAMERVLNDLYNHGKDGLLTTVKDFISRHDEREELIDRQQDERHRKNASKINVILAMSTVALVIVTLVGIYVSVEVSRHSNLKTLDIFHSQSLDPMLSLERNQPQDAGSSIAVHY